MRFRNTVRRLLFFLLAAAIAFALYSWAKRHPQDVPWTRLDLGQPIGLFTGRKLAALADDAPLCRVLLDEAGVRYTQLPTIRAQDGACGYADGVRFTAGGARRISLAPGEVGMACPVAAALSTWEWQVVQPAALRHFGVPVARIDHFGSYSCRRLYGRREGGWSEHATADAIDIAGFRLADGSRITIVGDWNDTDDDGAKAAFLRDVRDGACDLFATTLSPDYNAAHADHLHLDQAERGAMGGRVCR